MDGQISLIAATFGALTLTDIERMTLQEIAVWHGRALFALDQR